MRGSGRVRPCGRRAATATHHRRSGTAAVTLTSVPSASAAVAHSSRPEKTSARAAATASATSRSLCPLAALWNSTTGFSPTSATANASRSGRTLRTRPATTNTVARLAAIAITRNVETIVPTSSVARVTSAEIWVQSAP